MCRRRQPVLVRSALLQRYPYLNSIASTFYTMDNPAEDERPGNDTSYKEDGCRFRFAEDSQRVPQNPSHPVPPRILSFRDLELRLTMGTVVGSCKLFLCRYRTPLDYRPEQTRESQHADGQMIRPFSTSQLVWLLTYRYFILPSAAEVWNFAAIQTDVAIRLLWSVSVPF